MRNLLFGIVSFLCIALWGCNSDEPKFDDSTGRLIVHLRQDGADDVDFSEYSVAIIPEQGFIPSAQIKDIEWPVEVYVGTYTIAAASPQNFRDGNNRIMVLWRGQGRKNHKRPHYRNYHPVDADRISEIRFVSGVSSKGYESNRY